ncbi:MAG TPA: hypothetical protein VFI42_16155 [Thermomicrobiaceae bacterium]|nr:hypothetical protein [Thermomicrobiaceae bacterium]
MYAGITILLLQPDRVDEAIDFLTRLGDELIIPFARQLPGYRGHLGLADREAARFTAIFFYQTRAQAGQMDPSGRLWRHMLEQLTPEQAGRLRDLLAAPPERGIAVVVSPSLAALAPDRVGEALPIDNAGWRVEHGSLDCARDDRGS